MSLSVPSGFLFANTAAKALQARVVSRFESKRTNKLEDVSKAFNFPRF